MQGLMVILFLMLLWLEGFRYAIRPLPELASRRTLNARPRLRGSVPLDMISLNLLMPAPVVALTTPAPVPARTGERTVTFWTVHLEDGERLIYARSL